MPPTQVSELWLSDLVERSGVPASTIHHYRRTGMIPPPLRRAGSRFVYDASHVEALVRLRTQSTADSHPEVRARIVAAAIEAFRTRSYAEVSVSDIAEASDLAKGSVYRYFDSKETLLTAAIETLLDETTDRFESALEPFGGPESLRGDPERAASVLGFVLADVLPMLLELGARAARGHEPSAELARKVLRTLAETAGRPFLPDDADTDKAVTVGLGMIQAAFATVMTWAVGPDWPPDHLLPAGGA